jgi:hypothetical protein
MNPYCTPLRVSSEGSPLPWSTGGEGLLERTLPEEESLSFPLSFKICAGRL